jgi:hypothetical protein
MSDYSKEFVTKVKSYIHLAKKKGLNSVYEMFNEDETPLLTQLLLDSGINPLSELNWIPDNFATETSIPSDLIIPDHIYKIGEFSFFTAGLKRVEVGDNVRSIGKGAFANNPNLTQIEFSSYGNLTHIGDGAFSNLFSIQQIYIPEGVEIIEQQAFEFNKSLKGVTLPSSLKHLGSGTFFGASRVRVFYNGSLEDFSHIDWKDEYLDHVYCRDINGQWVLYKFR